jgi:hypothetical protein
MPKRNVCNNMTIIPNYNYFFLYYAFTEIPYDKELLKEPSFCYLTVTFSAFHVGDRS